MSRWMSPRIAVAVLTAMTAQNCLTASDPEVAPHPRSKLIQLRFGAGLGSKGFRFEVNGGSLGQESAIVIASSTNEAACANHCDDRPRMPSGRFIREVNWAVVDLEFKGSELIVKFHLNDEGQGVTLTMNADVAATRDGTIHGVVTSTDLQITGTRAKKSESPLSAISLQYLVDQPFAFRCRQVDGGFNFGNFRMGSQGDIPDLPMLAILPGKFQPRGDYLPTPKEMKWAEIIADATNQTQIPSIAPPECTASLCANGTFTRSPSGDFHITLPVPASANPLQMVQTAHAPHPSTAAPAAPAPTAAPCMGQFMGQYVPPQPMFLISLPSPPVSSEMQLMNLVTGPRSAQPTEMKELKSPPPAVFDLMANSLAQMMQVPHMGANSDIEIGAQTLPTTLRIAPNCPDPRPVQQALPTASIKVSITDVAELAQLQVGDDVTINQIRNTRSTYSLTIADIKYLKSKGVSDRVIMEMQGSSAAFATSSSR